MKALEQYFLEEMRALHQDAQEFAEDFPEQAAMLNLKDLHDKDPYVERLLEGVAYLTARIRQQIDKSEIKISETILEQLCPDLLHPIPSLTMMEYKFKLNSYQQKIWIEQGEKIFSNKLADSKIIGFSACENIPIYPIHIKYINVFNNKLELILQTLPHVNFNELNIENIPIFIQAESLIALEIFMLFTQELCSIEVEFSKENIRKFLPITDINIYRNKFYKKIFWGKNRSWLGFNLIQEYFSFREKFLFIYVPFSDIEFLDNNIKELKFIFTVSENFKFPSNISRDNFKLHCSPAINLLETSSEPFPYKDEQLDYPIVADYQQPTTLIYDISSVHATNRSNPQGYLIEPFYHINLKKSNCSYYKILRQDFKKDRSVFKLNLINIDSQENLTIQAKIIVCHGDQAYHYLQENMLTKIHGEIAMIVDAKNISRPTPMLLPPARENYQRQLLSLLKRHVDEINSRESLCQLLEQFEWTSRRDNVQRIAGIKDVEVFMIHKFIKGKLIFGSSWTIILDTEYYASLADAYHFAYFLHLLLFSYHNVNEVVEIKISLTSPEVEWIWKE